jgi:glucose-6-phosphate isomerase
MGPNPLRKFADDLGLPTLDHHPGIGGRFSGLSNVGLLPALSRGHDAKKIRAGAAEVVDELMRAGQPEGFAPAAGAAATVALMQSHGVRTLVMLPYADRLAKFADWWVQLWAESLGKDGRGSSPVAALGPLDQHSQLQLWMEGPVEHLLTVIRPQVAGTGPRLPAALARRAGIPMLAGRSIGDLVAAQAEAIPEALRTARRPVRVIDVDEVDERTVGALMMHFFIETILAAALLGVDPFGQPGVELGKRLAKARLEKG